MKDLNYLLSRVSVEDKAKVFDALVREFQNSGRYVGAYRVLVQPTRASVVPPSGPPTCCDSLAYKEVPMYDFVLRVNGHSDFFSAILHLAGVDSV